MQNSSIADEVVKRLDTMIAILQLAFKDEIDVARKQVLSDPVAASILEIAASGWIDSGDLKSRVAQETQQSERTVSRRIASLVSERALEQSGTGPRVRYRSTGLI